MRTLFVNEYGHTVPPPPYGQAYYLRASTITATVDGELVQVCSVEPMHSPVPPQIITALGAAR